MKPTFLAATTLAAVLAVSLVVTPAAFASTNLTDARGDTKNPDFDIIQGSFNEQNNPFIKVVGEAGGTRSTADSPAFGYAFAFTSGDHYVVASHKAFSDSNEGNGADDWHAHKIAISSDAGSHFACVTSANDEGRANLYPHKVILQNVEESKLDHVATVTITAGDPTSSCPALVDGSALYVDILDIAEAH